MNRLLEGRKAAVLGASRGIGRAIAEAFAREGAEVLLTGRNPDTLEEVAEEIREQYGPAHILAEDISDPEFPRRLLEAAEALTGIDILVINAGVIDRAETLSTVRENWNHVIDVDLSSPFFCTQALIPQMIEKGKGKIIFISSTAGKSVNMGASPSYGAAKAGLIYLTRHLATEFAGRHIYVNAICPGPVQTEITKTWSAERKKEVQSHLPLGRIGQPEDIAELAVFLASDRSDYITGESVMINGGRFMD